MSLGPEKIILILVVALIVFGPQRLPDIARQVGAMMRELRRMQDTVRDELENVLHPDFVPGEPGAAPTAGAAVEDLNHSAANPPALASGNGVVAGGAAPDMTPIDMQPPDAHANGIDANGVHANGAQPDDAHFNDDVTDDGFAGPRSFS
jgi:Tat protein translocase TatB subunit